jgi:magnesium transporter
MITIRQSTPSGFDILEQAVNFSWIDVIDPTPEEIRQVQHDLHVPLEFLAASLNQNEIARIEKAADSLLIIVRIPYFLSPTARIPYLVPPMGIIVKNNRVTTICRYDHQLLHNLPYDQAVDLSTAKPAGFVLHLLWSVASNYIVHLDRIDQTVEKLESRLQKSLQNREVLELLRYQKCLVHFTTGLHMNETMLERLRKSEALKIEGADRDWLDEVFTEYRQAIGMADVAGNILGQMMDAFASIISNNLNRVMKFMTSMTVILVIPSIIASLYGMNVALPMQNHPQVFLLLLVVSAMLCAGVAYLLWRRDWL